MVVPFSLLASRRRPPEWRRARPHIIPERTSLFQASSRVWRWNITQHAHDLAAHLRELKALRGHGRPRPRRLAEVKRLQAHRLAHTYADLSAHPRYRAATHFFLADLYGEKDFSQRDREMLKIVPAMSRVLPASAVETASHAIELEALSEALDQRLAEALGDAPLDEASYALAYRESSSREEREHQVDLVVAVGHRLDGLVRKPFISQTLKLMRQPARVAGLSDLQDFLERGFEAFRAMHGSHEFLETFALRERRILANLFSAKEDPFRA